MRRLIAAALELGWSLWAYEAVFTMTADTDPAEFRTMEFTNWREREQAANLCRLTAADPAEPLLVWCGNGHAWPPAFAARRRRGSRRRSVLACEPQPRLKIVAPRHTHYTSAWLSGSLHQKTPGRRIVAWPGD
jgi:hypothetical protein